MATLAHVSAHIWLCAVHTTLRPLSLSHMRAPVRAHPGKSYISIGTYFVDPLCDDGGSHIVKLELDLDHLHGSISPALGSLTHLTWL